MCITLSLCTGGPFIIPIQIDATMEEIGIGTRTDGTGIRETPVAVTSESVETQVGGTAKRIGIGTTGISEKVRRVVMQIEGQRGTTSGTYG